SGNERSRQHPPDDYACFKRWPTLAAKGAVVKWARLWGYLFQSKRCVSPVATGAIRLAHTDSADGKLVLATTRSQSMRTSVEGAVSGQIDGLSALVYTM